MIFSSRKNIIFLLPVILILSCSKSDITYVQTIPSSGNPAVTQTDTFSGKFIIFQADSFVTNNTSSIYLGYYKDPVFGKIKCESYLKINMPNSSPETDNNAVYDSIALIIHTDSSYYGDTSSLIKIAAYRLQDKIEVNSDNNIFNKATLSTYSSPLGTTNIVVRPKTTDSIRIKIDDTFGKDLFNQYMLHADNIQDSAHFNNYFRGIKLQTDNASTNAIYGLRTSGITLRMYYHIDNGFIVNLVSDFAGGSHSYQFTNITADRSGTVLEPLDRGEEIDASTIGNKFYMQELTAVRTRMSFSNLGDILKQGSFVKILAADLEIKPVAGTYSMYPLPSQMYLYFRDIGGTLSGPLYSSDQSYIQSGDLNIDNLYGIDTRYIYDVSSYVQNEMTANTFSTRSIVPIPSTNNTRVTCGTSDNANYKTRLIISTLTYQQ